MKYDGDGFNHYTTLRNTSSTIPKAYPPEGGAVDFGTSYTTDATKTLAYDATADGGSTYHYRATAFDAEDRVIAASSVKSVIARGVKSLGELAVGGSAGAVFLDWTPYGGSGPASATARSPGPRRMPSPPASRAIRTSSRSGTRVPAASPTPIRWKRGRPTTSASRRSARRPSAPSSSPRPTSRPTPSRRRPRARGTTSRT